MQATRYLMNRPYSAVRWAARISAGLLIGFIAMFAIGEGLPNPLGQPIAVSLEFVAFAVILAGLVLSLWKGWHGAVVTMIGLAAFCAVELAVDASLPGPAFALFAVPAALYVAAWWCERRERMSGQTG